jgi:lysophospholipase L1-like esterase
MRFWLTFALSGFLALGVSRRFDFGSGEPRPGYIRVTPESRYSDDRGYGFEASDTADGSKASVFSVKLPEGNYHVKVVTGDRVRPTNTTIKAELRRLMVEASRTRKGEHRTSEFVVNIRTPEIEGGGHVRLKDREKTSERRAWDDKLTLEFVGERPAVESIDIESVDDLPVLYIIGDSTVCDQPSEPYASWGQMLTRFFGPTIVLANHGESGESFRGSLGARRFDKVFSLMRPGDYLIMQFGHNDMKSVDEKSYADSIRRVVAKCREKNGIPIVVSPMERLGFDEDGKVRESLRGFPKAAKDTARELGVPFIDLHAMSKQVYEALGPEKSALAFAHPPGGKLDKTHHNNYGSYELAKCVVKGIRQNVPELAGHLADGLPVFDPAQPDDVATFDLPASPRTPAEKPEGS